MFKVAFIGAGSVGFTRELVKDLMTVPEFKNIEISLMDINEQNLSRIHSILERDFRVNNVGNKLSVTTDRREALSGARYIINTARVGGIEAFGYDVEIPLKYGVDQCVGDTLCAGGIMYGQRGIHYMLGLCKDIREVAAPGALLLNYGNPNAMMTWAANHHGGVNCIGLCHGVQGGHQLIAYALNTDIKNVDIICAGINHQTWYISVKVKGRPVSKEELLAGFTSNSRWMQTEKVRIDMLKRFGYFTTESNGHCSEYVSWYRKRPEEVMDWIDMDWWMSGETGGYLRVCRESWNWFEKEKDTYLNDEVKPYTPENRSVEHGIYIIESLETGRIYRAHINLVNHGTISNLPQDAIVEVPAYVDFNGISVPRVGDLPLGCAAVCNASISVQRLAVEAAVHGDIDLLRQAFMMDPLVGAVCNPPEIWQMVDEMLVAEEKWLPQYAKDIALAKARLADVKNLIPVKEGYKGAAVRKQAE